MLMAVVMVMVMVMMDVITSHSPGENPVSDNLWRPQIDDLPPRMLPDLIEKYKVLVYVGNYDGSMYAASIRNPHP